jgi:hypothetical protein
MQDDPIWPNAEEPRLATIVKRKESNTEREINHRRKKKKKKNQRGRWGKKKEGKEGSGK